MVLIPRKEKEDSNVGGETLLESGQHKRDGVKPFYTVLVGDIPHKVLVMQKEQTVRKSRMVKNHPVMLLIVHANQHALFTFQRSQQRATI